MPLRKDIHKVMVLGSGPIGYRSGCRVRLCRHAGVPRTARGGSGGCSGKLQPGNHHDRQGHADKVYIEPMTVEAVQEIIKKEHPDSLLPNLGGQTGLNLAMELCENGFLDKMGVKLLGANPTTIAKAEDRQMFKDTMEKIGDRSSPPRLFTRLRMRLISPVRSVCRSSSVRRTRSAAPAAALPTPGSSCAKLRPPASCTRVLTRFWSRSASQAGRKSSTR